MIPYSRRTCKPLQFHAINSKGLFICLLCFMLKKILQKTIKSRDIFFAFENITYLFTFKWK